MKFLSSVAITFLVAYLAQAAPLPADNSELQVRGEHQHGYHHHHHESHEERSLEVRADGPNKMKVVANIKTQMAKASRKTKESLGKAKHPVVKAMGGPPMVKPIKKSDRRPNFADKRSLERRGNGSKTEDAKNKAAKAARVTKEALGKAKHPVVKALGGPPMVKQIKKSDRRPNFADKRSLERRNNGSKKEEAKNKVAKASRVTKEALGKAKHPIVKALGGPPMVKQIKPSERRPNFADRRSLEFELEERDEQQYLEARGEGSKKVVADAKNKAAKATRVTKEALGKAKHPIVKAMGGPPMAKQIKPSQRRPNFAD